MRHRVAWVDKKRKGVTDRIYFEFLIKHEGKYFLLDTQEFVSVTQKFDGKYWYEVILEGN